MLRFEGVHGARIKQDSIVIVLPDVLNRVERHADLVHPGDLVTEPVLSKYLVQDETYVRTCSPVAVVVERTGGFQDAPDLKESRNHHSEVATLVRCADILKPRKINGRVKHGGLIVYTGFVCVAAVLGNEVSPGVERWVCVDEIDTSVW